MTIDVTSEFDAAAASYDRLVGASPGYYSNLSRSAHRMQIPGNGAGLHLLDLGCGTGASTLALLAAAPKARITAVDASAGSRCSCPSMPTRSHACRLLRTYTSLAGFSPTSTAARHGPTSVARVQPAPSAAHSLCTTLATGLPSALHAATVTTGGGAAGGW